MRLLASGDTLISLSGHRRQQVWDAAGLLSAPALLKDAPVDELPLELPAALEGEEVLWDYASTGLTLRSHPLMLLRPQLEKRLKTAAALHGVDNGRHVRYCGLVTLRQRPDTAGGTIFLSLEDETGVVQVVCWKRIREKQRNELLRSRLLAVYGTWQSEGELWSLIAERLEELTPLLGRLSTTSRDFQNGTPSSQRPPIDVNLGHLIQSFQAETPRLRDANLCIVDLHQLEHAQQCQILSKILVAGRACRQRKMVLCKPQHRYLSRGERLSHPASMSARDPGDSSTAHSPVTARGEQEAPEWPSY